MKRSKKAVLQIKDLAPAGKLSVRELSHADLKLTVGGKPALGGGGTSTFNNDVDGATTCTICCDCD